MLQYQSGIHRLINTEALHDTYYKHLKYKLSKQGAKMQLIVQINYVVQSNYDG